MATSILNAMTKGNITDINMELRWVKLLRLSGDNVQLDKIELLLIRLRDRATALNLQALYLRYPRREVTARKQTDKD
jgi:hypothetical protein